MNSRFFPPAEKPTSLISWCWKLCKVGLFLALVGIAGWLFLKQTVGDRLADLVEQKLNQDLAPFGLVATVGNAQLQEHQGIRLGNVAIDLGVHLQEPDKASDGLEPTTVQPSSRMTNAPRSRLQVAEIFVHVDATMADLATHELQPHAIELKRGQLTLVRSPSGEWDFQNVVDKLMAMTKRPKGDVPIVLSDCEVRLVDRAKPNAPPVVISGMDFSVHQIEHAGRSLTQVAGQLRSRAVSQVGVTAFLDPVNQVWQAKLTAIDARLSRDMIKILPPDLATQFDRLKSLAGKIQFEAVVQGDMALQQLPRFNVDGQIVDLSIDDQRLPVVLHNVSSRFSLNNDGFAVSNVTGELGDEGTFQFNYWQAGLWTRNGWHSDGWVKHFHFEDRPRMARWLPEYCRRFCEEYSPRGTSNIVFDLTHDGNELRRQLDAQLTNMSFSYVKLPYRVDRCVGVVKWVDDHCDFDVRSNLSDHPVRLHGFADNVSQNSTYQVNIEVPQSVPVDQKLFDAIAAQPKLDKVVRAFNLKGRVGGTAFIEKPIPNGDVRRKIELRLQGCEVRHTGFDYPIYNIDGTVEVVDQQFTFREVHGNNSSGEVSCNGSWSPEAGLQLRFLCDAVPMNDQLKFALKPEVQEVWNSFRPRGKLDFLKVDMSMPPGKQLNIALEAILREAQDDPEANYVSINPVWFPYEINHLTGTFQLADGKIHLSDVAGQHQKTWVACKGQGHYSDQSWSLRLENFLVSALKVDDDLLAAVPSNMAAPLSQLRYDGLLNVHGEITLAGNKSRNQSELSPASRQKTQLGGDRSKLSPDSIAQSDPFSNYATRAQGAVLTGRPPQRTSLAWNLRLDMNQANMQIGIPIKNVFGAIQVTGFYDGYTLNCDGALDIDSLTIYDTQMTQIRGPLRIENDRVLGGVFAEENRTEPTNNLSPIDASVTQSITGRLHGGLLAIDAQLDSAHENEFYLQASLQDSCLATACREIAPDLENVEGSSFAKLRLRGNGSGTFSHRGVGNIKLRDAKIYELPVFLSLLKILKVRQPSRTAFDSGNIDFSIHGESILFDRMEFNGDAISLIGNGQMNRELDIDLDFYSVMGRNRLNIPLLTKLVKAGSQRVLHISVDGKINDPRTHHRVLPQLSDLKQLFQPPNRIRRDPLVAPASAVSIGENYFQRDAGSVPFRSQIK